MYPGFNAQPSQRFAVRKPLSSQQFHSNQGPATDGFDIWWQKTFAQHVAVVAEASALMRAHQRIASTSQARVGNTH